MEEISLPKMVWMEIDLDNKELPLELEDTAAELAKKCGVSESTIRSACSRRKQQGANRRFVKVWIGG